MDPDVSTSSCSDASDSDDTDSEPDIVQPPSLDLGISKLEVEVNDGCLGVQLDPCPLPLSLEELKSLHPEAFTPESKAAVQSVCSELPVAFNLSPYQEFAVNALLNRQGGQQTSCNRLKFNPSAPRQRAG